MMIYFRNCVFRIHVSDCFWSDFQHIVYKLYIFSDIKNVKYLFIFTVIIIPPKYEYIIFLGLRFIILLGITTKICVLSDQNNIQNVL